MMTYKLDMIVKEYDESAEFKEEFQKNRWGSYESMINRMHLAMLKLSFSKAQTWLDVGCGTGLLQQLVSQKFPHIKGLALDVSLGMLKAAQQKNLDNILFTHRDFCQFNGQSFDVITCLGVLQKTSFNLNQFFIHSQSLLNNRGKLFVSTKNKHWKQFENPHYEPYEGHQWFSYSEIEASIKQLPSLRIIEFGGFLPSENRLVELNDSHDMFLVVEKQHE